MRKVIAFRERFLFGTTLGHGAMSTLMSKIAFETSVMSVTRVSLAGARANYSLTSLTHLTVSICIGETNKDWHWDSMMPARASDFSWSDEAKLAWNLQGRIRIWDPHDQFCHLKQGLFLVNWMGSCGCLVSCLFGAAADIVSWGALIRSSILSSISSTESSREISFSQKSGSGNESCLLVWRMADMDGLGMKRDYWLRQEVNWSELKAEKHVRW